MLQDTLWTLQDIGWTTVDEHISKLKVRRFPVNYVGKIYNRDLIIGNAYISKRIKQRKIKLSVLGNVAQTWSSQWKRRKFDQNFHSCIQRAKYSTSILSSILDFSDENQLPRSVIYYKIFNNDFNSESI